MFVLLHFFVRCQINDNLCTSKKNKHVHRRARTHHTPTNNADCTRAHNLVLACHLRESSAVDLPLIYFVHTRHLPNSHPNLWPVVLSLTFRASFGEQVWLYQLCPYRRLDWLNHKFLEMIEGREVLLLPSPDTPRQTYKGRADKILFLSRKRRDDAAQRTTTAKCRLIKI